MEAEPKTPTTLLEAVAYFADPERAWAYAVRLRWPNGIACPRMGCGSASVQAIKTRKTWRCKECGRQFSVRVGTIFEDSPIPFTKWLPAIWLLANTKNGTSSHELGRAIGVTQKTAWFMFHRIRLAMKAESLVKLGGEVEADETFIGGRHANLHMSQRHGVAAKSGWEHNKSAVFGMIQRKGKVRAFLLPGHTPSKGQIVPIMRRDIRDDATVYTDSAGHYRNLDEDFLFHESVNHDLEEYVRGRVHTNTIENFWSCLKRSLTGTYIAARPFHLQAYIDEQVFRFNERGDNDPGRFVKTLKNADGRRVTYKELTSSHPLWRLKPGRAINSPLYQA